MPPDAVTASAGPVRADIDDPRYVADFGDGFEVAARLGLDIAGRFEGGAHGTVFLLSDDRVLKVTHRVTDAVTALLLLGRQTPGTPVHGFPRIDGVHRIRSSVEVNGIHYALDGYAIVREEAEDLVNGWPGGNDGPHWTHAVAMVRHARSEGLRTVPDLGPASHCAPDAPAIVDILDAAERDLGIRIVDVRTSNLGLVDGERLVIRDFDPEALPNHLIDLRDAIPDIPALPANYVPPGRGW